MSKPNFYHPDDALPAKIYESLESDPEVITEEPEVPTEFIIKDPYNYTSTGEVTIHYEPETSCFCFKGFLSPAKTEAFILFMKELINGSRNV